MVGKRDKLLLWLANQPQDKEYEITERRKKRSLSANAYFYVLVNKIAEAQRISDAEVHDKLLSENLCFIYNGDAIDWKVCLDKPIRYRLLYSPNAENREYWLDSCMRVNLTRDDGTPLIDKSGKQVQGLVYWHIKGSHQMNSKEMARLIDSTIQEAKQLDIETLPPEQLRQMIEAIKECKG